MSQELKLPDYTSGVSTWGPSESSDLPFNGLPFVPFTKSDTIKFVADWTPSFWGNSSFQRRTRGQRERIGDDQAVLGNFSDDENEFHAIVKTKKYEQKSKYNRYKDWSAHRDKMAEAHERLQQRELTRIENAPQSKFRPKQQAMRRRRRKKLYENPRPTTISIKKSDSWQLMCDLWFNSMIEMSVSVPTEYNNRINTSYSAGSISKILNNYDAIRCRTPTPLSSHKFSDLKYKHFDYVSASRDPILLSLAIGINKKRYQKQQKSSNSNNKNNNKNMNNDGKWKIFTTDTILAILMCIIRSKYSFDIVISKIGKNIFLDQRSSTNSIWHVDETSQNRPTKRGTTNVNKYIKLATEATFINHILTEQLVSHKPENIINLQRRHPFSDIIRANASNKSNRRGANNNNNNNDVTLASTAFIYKTFDLPGSTDEEGNGNVQGSMMEENEEEKKRGSGGNDDIRIYARCSAHGFDSSESNIKKNNFSFVNIYALNQYDYIKSKTADWNKELDQGMSGILLTEIANNAFKISRMVIQSYLVGANTMKLGFVTRVKSNNDTQHQIVGVKTFNTKDMLKKCNIQLKHEWGILRHIINLIKQFDDGRYIAVRDPLKQVIRFYKVEPSAFGKDDEIPSLKDLKKQIDFSKMQTQQQSQSQSQSNNNNTNTNANANNKQNTNESNEMKQE